MKVLSKKADGYTERNKTMTYCTIFTMNMLFRRVGNFRALYKVGGNW